MIIRSSTALVRPGMLDEFRAFIEAGITRFASLDGFLGDEIVVGPDTLTYVSRWRDVAALVGYAGPGWRTEPVVLEDEDRFLLAPLRVRHVELRQAVPEDAPDIADVWHAAWVDGLSGLVPPELKAARPRDSFGPRAAALVPGTTVADAGAADGGVVGFVTVHGDEIEKVFVSATHRGSGIAAHLLCAGEGRVAAAGHAEAWLAVVTDNGRARRFYERQGWSDAGPFDYQAETAAGPVPLPTRRYVKRLVDRSS
ncbi:hypothetical protein GCM10027063_30350 [Promicromonospora xylanilytica]